MTDKEKDSKRLNIVVDSELHKQLKVAAAERGTTVSSIVSEACKKELEELKK